MAFQPVVVVVVNVSSGTVPSGCTDPIQLNERLLGYCTLSRIQKSSTGDNNFVKWEGYERKGSVKKDNLQRWSQILHSDRTERVRSIKFLTEVSRTLGWMKAPKGSFYLGGALS